MNKNEKCQECGAENVRLNYVAIKGEVKRVCEICEDEQSEVRRKERRRGSGPWCSTLKG